MAKFQTENLYEAAAIIWESGVYPDGFSAPNGRGIVSVLWETDAGIAKSVDRYKDRSMRVDPRGLAVIHINLKRKIKTIQGARNDRKR